LLNVFAGLPSAVATASPHSPPLDISRATPGAQQMFLARVLLGKEHVCPANAALIKPPDGHHSVKGNTGGSDISIIYDLDQAYPAYVVEYTLR